MKTLVVKVSKDCPYHDGTYDECAHEYGPMTCLRVTIPKNCPLREGLTITVEEE